MFITTFALALVVTKNTFTTTLTNVSVVKEGYDVKNPPTLKLRWTKRGVAQLASVLAWGASGRPFESDHPDK
jgi:hypothetical protein